MWLDSASCIIRMRDKPVMHKDAERDAEREITESPHDTCSKLLILQSRESTRRLKQVYIRSIERYLGKSNQHSQNKVLCNGYPHTAYASEIAQRRAEWR